MVRVGNVLLEPEDGWKRYSNNDKKFEYKYLQLYEKDYGWGNTIHFSNTNGSSVKFNIISDKLRIILPLWYDGAKEINVKINNENVGSYSCYTSNNQNHTMVFEKKFDEYREYCVELTKEEISGYFYFDEIHIDKNGELKPYNYEVLCNNNIILENKNKTIYPNIYIDKKENFKFTVNKPTCEKEVVDNLKTEKNDFQDGLLYETDYLDLIKYKEIKDITFLRNTEED